MKHWKLEVGSERQTEKVDKEPLVLQLLRDWISDSRETQGSLSWGQRDLGFTGILTMWSCSETLSNSSLTQLREYDRFIVNFSQMMDGWMCMCVSQWASLSWSCVVGRMDGWVQTWVWFGELTSQGQSGVMDSSEMSVSSPGTSCPMMSQCTWGMDLGGGWWLYPSVCFPLYDLMWGWG